MLDVDGEAGRRSLNELLARLGLETIADLTSCVSRTPSGGLHLIFRLQPGVRPRNRARDIGAGIDTRGVKADGSSAGYFIAPGSMLPDGRCYGLIDAATLEPIELPSHPFDNAAPAHRGLLYLASFNASERAVLAAVPALKSAIQHCDPSDWQAIFERHRVARRATVATRLTGLSDEAEGMRAQALHDLREAAAHYAKLTDGRREQLWTSICRLAKYVRPGLLVEEEVRSAFGSAAISNGARSKYGAVWEDCCITRALRLGQSDPLPPLARRFRTVAEPRA